MWLVDIQTNLKFADDITKPYQYIPRSKNGSLVPDYGLRVGLEHYGLRVGLERPHGWVGASSYYGLRVGLERPHGRVGASSYYGLRVGLEHYGLRVGLEHYGLRSQVMMMWSIWFWFVDLLVREQGPSYDQSLPVVGDHIHSMSSH
ncbi:hypothetical protein DPMN_036233, partial [Dreissena polymorpha]